MDEFEKLQCICMEWPELIRQKKKIYAQIKDPMDRIIPALHLVNLRLELMEMEEEYCRMIRLEPV